MEGAGAAERDAALVAVAAAVAAPATVVAGSAGARTAGVVRAVVGWVEC